MAAQDVSRGQYRGLIIPDGRVANSAITDQAAAGSETTATQATPPTGAKSKFSQASPLPGVAEGQDSPRSAMVFETSGSQSADGQLRLRGGRAGFPGRDSRGGGVLWRNQGDNSWRGWDIYGAPTGFEFLQYITDVSTAEASNPHTIRHSSGVVLTAYHYSTTGSDDVIRVRSLTPGSAWSSATTITPSSQHASFYPCLLEMLDESVLLFAWVVDTYASLAQIRVWRSTDVGSTWSVATSFALASSVDQSASGAGSTGFDLGRIRAAYQGEQISLIFQLNSRNTSVTDTEVLSQWASDDMGATFTEVETWVADTTNGHSPEVIAGLNGGFLVFNFDPVSGDFDFRALSSAYEALSSVTATEITQPDKGAPGPIGNFTAWRDEDGTLYAVFNQPNAGTAEATIIVRSTDEGSTWANLFDDSTECLFFSGDASTYLRDYSATSIEGRAVLVSRFASNPGAIDDNTIGVVYLGGSTSITMPTDADFREDTSQTSFSRSWLPFEEPGDVAGWTKTSSGASPTDALTSSGLQIDTGTTETLYYERADGVLGSSAVESPWGFLTEVTVATGGGLTSNQVSILMTHADSGDAYEVSTRMTTTGFRVYDNKASSAIGSDVSVDMTAGVQIIAAIGAGNFACFYRLTGTDSDNDRDWSAGPSTTSLTSSGTGSKNFEWGNRATAGSAAQTVWKQMHIWNLASGRSGFEAGFTNPDDLFPRPLAARPIGIDDGVKVRAVDGPIFEGQTWNINTRYGFGIDRIDPAISPSPSATWRSTDETQQDIVWDLTGISKATRYGNTSIGLYLGNINWRTGSLWGGDAAGTTWTKIADLDAAGDLASLPYTRTGDVVHVDTGTSHTGTRWIPYNGFAGGSISLGSSKFRRIARHSEGVWTDNTTRRPDFTLADVDDTEPASGTLDIWSPRMALIAHAVSSYRYLRLRIDAQTTVDGYFQIGSMLCGPLVYFAHQYSRGRMLRSDPNVALQTSRAGARTSRKLGANRRAVSFSWAEGVQVRQPYASSDVQPDYILGTSTVGAEPVGAPSATPLTVHGVIDALAGSHTPVVYLPVIAKGTPDTDIMTDVHASLYGRIVSPVRLENVLGDEHSGERLRIQTIEIEEEL